MVFTRTAPSRLRFASLFRKGAFETVGLRQKALKPSSSSRVYFEALRSRQGQAEAILVAYDVMEVGGQDVRPEALEERGKPNPISWYLVSTILRGMLCFHEDWCR
jgi:hypothetical protein